MELPRGSISQRALLFIGDSSSTTGAGLTALAYNTGSLTCYGYYGDGSAAVAITLATATLGTFTSSGFVEVDATNMPGWYEFGIPNTALDTGNFAGFAFKGAANMVPTNLKIDLIDPPVANRTWYVRKTIGSDSNNGRSVDTAKLTIAAAVTAASNGDTIDIGAGTWTETIDLDTANKPLTFRGVSRDLSIITNSGQTVLSEHNCTFIDLSIKSTGTTYAGVTATSKNDQRFIRCYVEGYIDAVTNHSSKGFYASNCQFVGDWDGLGLNDAEAYYIEGSITQTTGEYTWNGSSYTGDTTMHGIQASGGYGIIRNSKLIGYRQHDTSNRTAALSAGTSTILDGVYLYTTLTSDTSTGELTGIFNESGLVEMRGCKFFVAQDTIEVPTASTYHLNISATGTVVDIGSDVDASEVTGAGTFTRTPANVRQWNTTAVPTPDTAGYPKVTVKSGTGMGEVSLSSGRIDVGKVAGQTASATATVDFDDLASAGAGDATAANQTLILNQVNKITTGRVNVISHVHANDVVVNQGETYSSSLNPLTFTYTSGDSWPTDLTAYTITLIATQTHDTTGATPTSPATISQTGSVATATGDSRAVRVDFTAAQTAALTPGLYEYYLKASTGSGGSTVDWLRQGQLRVIDATP